MIGSGDVGADLFSEALVRSYVDEDPRFVERPWLADLIEDKLADSGCRFLLLTGKPGSGKTALMAWLARQYRDWPRYFIRRDSQVPLNSGDARSLLFALGHQLAALRPRIFHPERLEVVVRQHVGEVAPRGRAVGLRVEDLEVSPFYATALRVEQEAGLVAGELAGISVARLVAEERFLELANLQYLALLDPAALLLREEPGVRLVLLVDALDELRYHAGRESALDWLAACPQLPANMRLVLTSRPDEPLLELFRKRQGEWLREAAIDADSDQLTEDLTRYATSFATEPKVAAVLEEEVAHENFVVAAVTHAEGNFQYLAALFRGIEHTFAALAHAEPGQESERRAALRRLLRLEEVPAGLGELYSFFVSLIRDAVAAERMEVPGAQLGERERLPAWEGLYQPVLGVLAVAYEPLTSAQIAAFSAIEAEERWLRGALARLTQFLDRKDGRYRLYHASFPEYLTAAETRESHPDDYLNPTEWHRTTAAYYWRAYAGDWNGCDEYGLRHLAAHLIAARQLDILDLLLTNLEFLAARVGEDGLDGAVRDFDAARIAQGNEWEEDGGQAQFSRFLSQRSHFLRFEPALIYQEAFNSIEARVQRSAANLQKLGRFPPDPWLRRVSGAVADYHSGHVISMAFWGGERYLTVSTTAREVWVWDCITGRVRTRCDPPPSSAKSLAVSPSGDHLAAGYGADVPTPFLAGVRIWSRDGGVAWTRTLDEWVYTVRWRSDTEILAGGGLPSGAEAVGTLWKIDIAAETCIELGNWLADRPVLLTWDPVRGDPDQVMALAHDGFVLHLRPEYVPISPQEAQDHSRRLMSDGDYDAHDARMQERRPIVHRICAPTADKFGYLSAADTIRSTKRICVLGEPPVPPEMLMLHYSNPDGIYLFDWDEGRLRRLAIDEEAREAGFKALCIAASPVGDALAIGTKDGAAYLFRLRDMHLVAPERVHHGSAPVTAACFSESGRRLAVGDAASQVAVYDFPDREPLFQSKRGEPAVAAQIDDERQLVLFVGRLEVGSAGAVRSKETVTWDDNLRAVDLARCGDLAVVLCRRDSEEPAGDDEQVLEVIDLQAPRVLVETPLPAIVPGSGRSGVLDTGAGHEFRRVALRVDEGLCQVYLASPDGVIEFPFLAHSSYRTFTLSEAETKRDREITVTRMGIDEPDLACRVFTTPTHDGLLFCGYADNAAHPNVSGELHCWDARTLEHSEVMRFTSAITAIEATESGAVVLGTEHGEVLSLKRDGEWRRLAELQHPVAVSCVAFDEPQRLACSVSREGLVLLWDLLNGTRRLSTSMDAEPVQVAFTSDATQLSIVDRSGQLHIWELENRSTLVGTTTAEADVGATTTEDRTRVVETCLRAAEQVGRAVKAVADGDSETGATLLLDLPDVPDRANIQRFWQALLDRAR